MYAKSEDEIRLEIASLKTAAAKARQNGSLGLEESGAAYALEWVLGEAIEKNTAPSLLFLQLESVVRGQVAGSWPPKR